MGGSGDKKNRTHGLDRVAHEVAPGRWVLTTDDDLAGWDDEAMRSNHRRHRLARRLPEGTLRVIGRLWLLASIALAATAAVVNYDLLAAEELGPLARDSEVAAAEAPALAAVADEFDAYPSVDYAGLEIALVEARVIPENRSGHPIIVADLAIRNGGVIQARLPKAMFNLVTAGAGSGEVAIEPVRFDYATYDDRLVIDPGATEQALAVFVLRGESAVAALGLRPEAGSGTEALGRFELRVGERGRWPVNLPLTGQAPEPAFPRDLEVVLAAPVAFEGLEVELTSARSALDYGIYRAPIDRQLAIVTVLVSGPPTTTPAIGDGAWSLVDDADGSRTPIRSRTTTASAETGVAELELVFAYEAGSTGLDLVLGAGRSEQVVARLLAPSFE